GEQQRVEVHPRRDHAGYALRQDDAEQRRLSAVAERVSRFPLAAGNRAYGTANDFREIRSDRKGKSDRCPKPTRQNDQLPKYSYLIRHKKYAVEQQDEPRRVTK